MKVYTYDHARHRSPNRPGGANDLPPLAPGISWARFGHETLLYGDAEGMPAGSPAASSRGARMPSRDVTVTPDQLHVVVQHGRLFQQQYPDVPVLHDRGRFLLVQLDPERVPKMRAEGETCFGVMPLAPNQVVFEAREASAPRAVVPFVQALVDKPARPFVEASLKQLVSFGTRNSTNPGHAAAAAFAAAELDTLGYTTTVQDVTVGGEHTHNVIADKPGSGPGPRRLTLVTAHLDSINVAGGPTSLAPGADDNGSGSAGVLEIARAFKEHRSVHNLRFILFSGEEQGHFGSKQYVATLPASERSRIDAVVNMDMIGSLNSSTRSVLLEGAPLSQAVIDGLSEAAFTYTQLAVETSLHPFASDHVPFINSGVPAVLTIEGADNTNSTIHSGSDTLERIDFEFLLEILRMNVGFIASSIGQVP